VPNPSLVIPTFPKVFSKVGNMANTPMDPVIVVGAARTRSAGAAM